MSWRANARNKVSPNTPKHETVQHMCDREASRWCKPCSGDEQEGAEAKHILGSRSRPRARVRRGEGVKAHDARGHVDPSRGVQSGPWPSRLH